MKYSDKPVLKVILGTTIKIEVKKYGFVTNFTKRIYFYCVSMAANVCVLVSVSRDCAFAMAMQIQPHVLCSDVTFSSNKCLF